MEQKIIVAIDGYSSSGKSTMAKELAKATGYKYVDSGAMYRAVTLYAMRHGMIAADGSIDTARLIASLHDIQISFTIDPATSSQHTLLDGEDVEKEIRSSQVAAHVSPVAAIPEVRTRLTAMQQAFGLEKGIVMDGRDIGTTVFPHAEMKVFVDASPEVRARRRRLEMLEKGEKTDFENVLTNVKERDLIDSTRAVSPLRKAPDAIVLCNDDMTLQQQTDWMLTTFNRIVRNGNDRD